MTPKLKWLVLGIVASTMSWLATAVFLAPVDMANNKTYLALLEPVEEPPPMNSGDFYIERLRHRDAVDEIYVGKIPFECRASKFDFVPTNHSDGVVRLSLEDTSAEVLDCIIRRATAERIAFEIRAYR